MSNDDIEQYMFWYRGWIEYYDGVMARLESFRDAEKVRNIAIKAAIYDNYKDKEEFTASELQRAKIIEGAPEFVDAAGDLIEHEHHVKLVVVQLAKLKERTRILSRIIELRTGGRRNYSE